MTQERFEQAKALIDAANSEDPNQESSDGKSWPKELLYSERMSDMLQRFAPQTDEVMQLGIRAQHIQRWKSPRSDYPMDKKGYFLWRTNLYKFHAETVCELMKQAGYAQEDLDRVFTAVSKKSLKSNPDTQLVEDIAALVFIEHYIVDFVQSKTDYDEAKWMNIILRTWQKMSDKAHQFALSGSISIPESLLPLIQKAIS